MTGDTRDSWYERLNSLFNWFYELFFGEYIPPFERENGNKREQEILPPEISTSFSHYNLSSYEKTFLYREEYFRRNEEQIRRLQERSRELIQQAMELTHQVQELQIIVRAIQAGLIVRNRLPLQIVPEMMTQAKVPAVRCGG